MNGAVGAFQGHSVLRPWLGCDPARMADITPTAPKPTPSPPNPGRGRHREQTGSSTRRRPDRQGQVTAVAGCAPAARAAPALHRALAGTLGTRRRTQASPAPCSCQDRGAPDCFHQSGTSDARTATADRNTPGRRRSGGPSMRSRQTTRREGHLPSEDHGLGPGGQGPCRTVIGIFDSGSGISSVNHSAWFASRDRCADRPVSPRACCCGE
jgi:hypothetical protein